MQNSMPTRLRLSSLFTQSLTRTRWTVDTVAGYLLVISTLYLAIPHLIFFVGWLQWPWAVLASAGLCVALVMTLRVAMRLVAQDQAAERVKGEFIFTRQHALMIGAVCLMWLTISGVGGFVAQDNDWDKHNTVLNSLMLKPWPTVYEIYKVNVPLVYYIAYYLPAALVGKVGGWFWANQALFLWSLIGLFIAALWFCVLVRRVSYSVLAIFVLFSGLDVVGKLIAIYGGVWNGGKGTWLHIDSWAGIWQYSSNATLLNWVPHQALAGWIVVGMTLYCLVTLRRRDLILLPIGLSAFWSPFITLGMIPYLVLDFLIDSEPFVTRVRRIISIPNVVGVLALAITGFYFSAKASDGSPIVIEDMFGGMSLANYSRSTLDGITFLLMFCLLEFGLYVLVLYRSGAIQEERWRWMLDITVLTLVILPWFKLGVYNDLVMRASIPALFVLAVLVARAVHDKTLPRQARTVLVVLLVVGAVTSGIELRRHFRNVLIGDAPIMDDKELPSDFVKYLKSQAFFFGQYSGGIESPFFEYAAKPIPAGAKAVEGSGEYALNDHDFVLYDNQVYLLRESVTLPADIAAGATMTVPWQLHFFGPAVAHPIKPAWRLVNEAGEAVVETEGWGANEPSIAPFSMTYWSGEMTMTVPITATVGLYQVEIGFTAGGEGKPLMGYSVPEGDDLGEDVLVGKVQVVEAE